jgi:hypothetical protein
VLYLKGSGHENDLEFSHNHFIDSHPGGSRLVWDRVFQPETGNPFPIPAAQLAETGHITDSNCHTGTIATNLDESCNVADPYPGSD